jgi:hypothetical protein
MKHERIKLLTFRTKEWMEESYEAMKWWMEASKNRGDKQEQRA